MENQTLSARIVLPEQKGIQARPGYYLVLFKEIKSSRVFHGVLQPNEWTIQPNPLKRLVLNEERDLVSIPVIADRSLRHEVISDLEHVSPGHAFKATYFLDFMVSAAETVAIGWQHDPLRQIEGEIHSLLDPISRTETWDTLRTHILRDAGALLFRDQLRDAVDELQPFALTRGFHVHGIRMKLELSRDEQSPEAARSAAERKQPVVEIDHAQEADAIKRREELRQLQRQSQINDAFTSAVVDALQAAGSDSESLRGRLRALRDLWSGLQGTGGNSIGTAFAPQPALLVSGGSPEGKASSAVADIAAVVEAMEGTPAKKQELLSRILHLIAEAYRGSNASSQEAGRYSTEIDEMIKDWGLDIQIPHFNKLGSFRDLAAIQQLLKP